MACLLTAWRVVAATSAGRIAGLAGTIIEIGMHDVFSRSDPRVWSAHALEDAACEIGR